MRRLLIFSFLVAAAMQATADVTYHYIGNPYNFNAAVEGGIETSLGTFLRGEVVFSDAVTSTFTGTVSPSDLLSAKFTSGSIIANTSDGSVYLPFFAGSTFDFVNGSPVFWFVLLQQNSGVPYEGPSSIPGFGRFVLATSNLAADGDNVLDGIGNLFTGISANVVRNNPGTWTRTSESTPVPLPSAIWMLAPALCGWGYLSRCCAIVACIDRKESAQASHNFTEPGNDHSRARTC